VKEEDARKRGCYLEIAKLYSYISFVEIAPYKQSMPIVSPNLVIHILK
jgi:hypothetical protein